MREREVKFLEVESEPLERQIVKGGGQKIFEGRIVAEYFNGLKGCKDLTVRLRTKGSKAELTTKEEHPNDKVRDCEELNAIFHTLKDGKQMRQILLQIGLKHVRTVTKDRLTYVFRDAKVDIDTIEDPDGVPTYAEVEADDPDHVEEVAKELGFPWKERKKWSTKKMLQHYKII